MRRLVRVLLDHAEAPEHDRAALRRLGERAREGDLQGVREALHALSPQRLGVSAWRRLDGAARQYDFDALARLADAMAEQGPEGDST